MMATDLCKEIVRILDAQSQTVSFAESCTGGGIAHALTDIPGSSKVFEHGFVTYSNTAKEQSLGVDPAVIHCFGAVSEQVVCAMAQGCLHATASDYSVAVSGIAGPEGGSQEKPVGTVWIAWCDYQNNVSAKVFHFKGDRQQVRQSAVFAALKGLLALIQ